MQSEYYKLTVVSFSNMSQTSSSTVDNGPRSEAPTPPPAYEFLFNAARERRTNNLGTGLSFQEFDSDILPNDGTQQAIEDQLNDYNNELYAHDEEENNIHNQGSQPLPNANDPPVLNQNSSGNEDAVRQLPNEDPLYHGDRLANWSVSAHPLRTNGGSSLSVSAVEGVPSSPEEVSEQQVQNSSARVREFIRFTEMRRDNPSLLWSAFFTRCQMTVLESDIELLYRVGILSRLSCMRLQRFKEAAIDNERDYDDNVGNLIMDIEAVLTPGAARAYLEHRATARQPPAPARAQQQRVSVARPNDQTPLRSSQQQSSTVTNNMRNLRISDTGAVPKNRNRTARFSSDAPQIHQRTPTDSSWASPQHSSTPKDLN